MGAEEPLPRHAQAPDAPGSPPLLSCPDLSAVPLVAELPVCFSAWVSLPTGFSVAPVVLFPCKLGAPCFHFFPFSGFSSSLYSNLSLPLLPLTFFTSHVLLAILHEKCKLLGLFFNLKSFHVLYLWNPVSCPFVSPKVVTPPAPLPNWSLNVGSHATFWRFGFITILLIKPSQFLHCVWGTDSCSEDLSAPDIQWFGDTELGASPVGFRGVLTPN